MMKKNWSSKEKNKGSEKLQITWVQQLVAMKDVKKK